ncbi:carbohydrate ABC transporter permease [Sinisalibacter aestuarii]|uniref:ABC transporter permease n=1 Tax=Sinisalibacter aestuarii TaxID=2949426 RepID=A0ABQ5LQW5_9RHOB|nr:sugar ABC transporter permease [Sinisalibacter aestuarii]GKY87405.1 ABC transporter permease [Sinisalibacter aestuarii]
MLRDWRFWFFLPTLLALGIVVLFPTGYLLWMSLAHWIITEPGVYFDGLANFRTLFRSASFYDSARVTALYLFFSTVIMMVFAMLMALALQHSRSGILRSAIVLPLVIPPVVAGFTWRFLLNGEIGFLGAWLFPMVGLDVNMLSNPSGALVSVIIADVWSRTPFMFLIFLAALQGIPRDYYEAVRLDGATAVQEFFTVTLPLMRSAVAVALLFRVVDAINTFELIYVMTKGGPGRATQTLSLLGWKTAFQNYDLGGAAALGVVMLVVTTISAGIMFARFMRKA